MPKPESQSSMFRLTTGYFRSSRGIIFLFLFVFLLFPYTVSFGDGEVTVRVTNQTDFYVHVLINDQPFLYLSPRRSVTGTVASETSVTMEAFYSPGQGIEGSARNHVQATTEVTGCSSKGNTCETTTSPRAGEVITWDVTSAILQGN